ncbi:MAG: hypothetical protein CVU56_02890 [Deltaproteobacteria bacterium HGW-Deltaproteobacteria-14]|nr:MAG: hypothetical protein CVU56_02890 [Deltaproteobacteria bacterium HGW-Deltaproteobacteria-14]
MKSWQAASLVLVAWAALRLGASDPLLTAADADALNGGMDLATALTADDGSLAERLRVGFATHEGNPRVALLPPDQKWRHAVVEPPVARWAVALGIMLTPGSDDTPNLDRAATGAALLVALALALLAAALWRRDRMAALVAPAVLLSLPGVLDAAHGPGGGAAALLAMTLLVLAVDRLAPPAANPGPVAEPAGAWPAAVAWALTLGLHPGAAFLVIPIFVAYAIARRALAGAPAGGGELRLPRAPLSLFLLPILGLVVFVALWPALWEETGKRTGSWLMDTWWLFNPRYDVAGVAFDQARDRAAMGWTGLATWAAWTPVSVLVAWVFGVARVVRQGRGARWFPLLAWVTLMLVGAADGGLFGGRLSLLPLLWVPTALVAAGGVAELADVARRRPGPRATGRARMIATAVVLAVPLASGLTGWPPSPLGGVGGELLRPVPLAWLREVAVQDPRARVGFTPEPEQWRPAVEVAIDAAELPLRWTPGDRADWLFVVGEPAGDVAGRLTGVSPVREGRLGGVTCRVYHLAPERLGAASAPR